MQIDTDVWLSAKERADRSDLARNLRHRLTLFYLIYYADLPIGWHSSYQIDAETIYMFDSGIVPDHQGKGVYPALLLWLLTQFKARGFQKVTSQHHASNNKVILPKLKAGFLITGFTLDESVGLMVQLTYAFHPLRKHVYEFRTGYKRPDEAIRKFL
ncbi:MAG: GNAT family N-acetyltransferase [Bacteroidetes bacterium]|nr:GNAT family N-acetyltransferase [Bacteroidota bacterium]MBS1618905.1 GNAT family N-acetyltransferase [Bacteroidota bacterium]